MPGVFELAVPEALVSTYKFSPLDSNPAGLMNVVRCMEPIWVAVAELAVVTDTVPSRPIVRLWVVAGIVIAGCTKGTHLRLQVGLGYQSEKNRHEYKL